MHLEIQYVVVTLFPANYTQHDNVTYIMSYLCNDTRVFIKFFIWILFSDDFPAATREAIVLIVLVAQNEWVVQT